MEGSTIVARMQALTQRRLYFAAARGFLEEVFFGGAIRWRLRVMCRDLALFCDGGTVEFPLAACFVTVELFASV